MTDYANTTKNQDLRVVKFHGDEIVTFESDGIHYVAMRRIVENMGLDWARQSVKLAGGKGKFNCCHMPTVGLDGKPRGMLAMPVEKMQLWLASINPNKIRDEAVRAKVERYQSESAIALHDYWTKGIAIRGDMIGTIAPVMTADMMASFGVMMDGIVQKQIALLLPAMVETALAADPRRAVMNYVSVRQLLEDGGALQKGRRGINCKMGYDLKIRALLERPQIPVLKCPHSGVWLYPRTFAANYMAARGDQLVKDHNAKVMGQGVLKLVPKKPVPAEFAPPPL